MTENLIDLKRLRAEELEALALSLGESAYRGRQLFDWLFRQGATSFEQMGNLPIAFRESLRRQSSIRTISLTTRQASRDRTEKSVYVLPSGKAFETVIIPDFADGGTSSNEPARRVTVCVSSQVGCAMACSFCATGRMGFIENLSASDIYDQVFHANARSLELFGREVSNVVFMGMGEPLLNFDEVVRSVELLTSPRLLNLSSRRITISTVGIAGRIRDLADSNVQANLAVSLHAPTDPKRSSIMPVNRKRRTDLSALREALEYYAQHSERLVTYEYCMFAGFNDSIDDAINLAEVARWVPSKVNLIMYNEVPGLDFRRTTESTLNAFVRALVDSGVTVTVRRSRGQDIAAACGQLAGPQGN
ncbi:MAG: 23S rRNA (adenine(2503)-C(2))-methyltransferase RlmN [Rhodothermales bacterium]